MVSINANLKICKNNLSELEDVIVASEDSKESMRRDLLKILRHFRIRCSLDPGSDTFRMK